MLYLITILIDKSIEKTRYPREHNARWSNKCFTQIKTSR